MRLIFVFMLAVTLFAACSSPATNQNSATAAPSASQPPAANNLSPSDAVRAYIEAARKKDLNEMEKYLSVGSVQLIENIAKEQNTNADEELSRIVDQVTESQEGSEPEFRNEAIEGDNASVELKNSVTGGWDKIPLVRENANWKLALDKQVADILKNSDEIEINKEGAETEER